jgi:hypothetical protein
MNFAGVEKAMSPEEMIEAVAEALANQIAMRKGCPPIKNCLALMPPPMADIFRDDARTAITTMEAARPPTDAGLMPDENGKMSVEEARERGLITDPSADEIERRKAELTAEIIAMHEARPTTDVSTDGLVERDAKKDEALRRFVDIVDGTEATGFDPHVEQMLMDAADEARKALSHSSEQSPSPLVGK